MPAKYIEERLSEQGDLEYLVLAEESEREGAEWVKCMCFYCNYRHLILYQILI